MKSVVLFLIIAIGVQTALAQEPPLPSATATPAPTPSVRPELNIPDIPLPVEPAPLVPNASPAPKKSVPSITELDSAFQRSPLGREVEEQRLHLEWRKLKNRTIQDPEVVAAKKAANAALTDPEKRELMRTYYKLLYAHMQAPAEAPDVKAYLEQKKNDSINSLAQPRIRPESTPRPSASR
jgi:hypothetical protein